MTIIKGKGLELTLAIVKPHAIKVPHILQEIQNIILSNGFYVIRSKTCLMSDDCIKLFYKEHEKRFFYNRLITLMKSGPSNMYILAREDAISRWRTLMGPTKVFKAQFTHPESIRGSLGLTDTRNATHGSDSHESAKKEINIAFPEFDYENWYKNEKTHYQHNDVIFSNEDFVHVAKKSMQMSMTSN